jgi:ATP-dependent DNA helicase DinG
VDDRFTDGALHALRDAILDAGGNEVFFLGTLSDGRVDSVRVLARGNRHSAPAILQVPRPGEVVIHNHPSGQLIPSDADIEVSSALGNNDVGSYIVDNAVRAVYVIVEPSTEHKEQLLDAAEAAKLLSPDGPIRGKLTGYEYRPEQISMLDSVVRAFNDAEVLSVEAGTGTGKSLAYLVPAILWSQTNRERVIVSTHTINLQEQLVGKDLPFLTETVGMECTIALVKGRSNYLCKRKAAQAEAQAGQLIEDDLARELRDVLDWSKKTTDGSLSDLTTRPRPEVWEQVVSENDNCLRARCPYYSECFFYSARRRAAAADILVVNHHLLMADLALRDEIDNFTQNAVLPPATRVIIDEAHHLEDVATTYFGVRLSYRMLERTLGRLQSRRNPAKGVLPALALLLGSVEASGDMLIAEGAIRWIEEHLIPRRASLASEAEECFVHLEDLYERLAARLGAGSQESKLRITEAVRETEEWARLSEQVTRLASAFDDYAVSFLGVLDRVAQLSESSGNQARYLATELAALQGRLSGYAAAFLDVTEEDDSQCRWLERNRSIHSGPLLSFHSAPIQVAGLLRRALFERFATTILTSATLAVDRSFDYLHQRLGISDVDPPERVRSLRIDSPFDFETQARLLVPTDLPDPTQPGHEKEAQEAIRLALHISQGGTFVLFTSYAALHQAYGALEQELVRMGLVPLKQGDLSRHVLLARFTQSPRSVLFATDSFWEGVDVRGDALRSVIIARLPFKVPTEPIERARVEVIEARGGNAFEEHALPQAVIKLKQGFGRLIRSRSDWGCVLILDSRIAHKRYGRVFLDSLPPARQIVAPSNRVFDEMARFFGERRGRDMEFAG